MLLQTSGEEIKQVHFLAEQCLCVQLSSPICPSVHRRVGCFHFWATPWLMLHEQVVQVAGPVRLSVRAPMHSRIY